jgi:GAF domain-containing protein
MTLNLWSIGLFILAVIFFAILYARKLTRKLKNENTELKRINSEKTEELNIIKTVGEGLARQLDFQSIIDLVGEKIRGVFNAQVVSISTYDKNTIRIHHRYVFENNQRFYFEESREIDSDRKEIIDSQKPLVFGTTKEIIEHSGDSVIAGEMPKSYLGVPIILNQEATGVVTVQDLDREYLYNEGDVRLLMTLASNMGVALENARLFEETTRLLNETQQSNAELAIINSVGEAMSKQLDFNTVTQIVGDKVKDIFSAEATEILLLDSETNIINVPYSFYKDYQNVKPFALGEGLTSKVIISKQPLVLGTLEEQHLAGSISDESVGEADNTESYMGVPILAGKKVLGVVSVQSYKKNAFDEKSVRLLSTLSSNMGVALENARLFEETNRLLSETKQRNQELAVINSVQEGLVAQMNIQSIYDLVGNEIRDIFNAQVVAIGSFDYRENVEKFNYVLEKGIRYHPEPRPFDKLRRHLIDTKQLILINENTEEVRIKFGLRVISGTEDPKSLLFVPLIVGEKVRGYISLQNVDNENAFSDSDVRLLTTLANSMSVALENARLFDETNRLLNETQQRNAELGVINSVQEGLVAKMEMQAIYELVGEKIREIFDAQVVSIGSYDYKSELCYFKFDIEKNIRFYEEPRKFNAIDNHLISTRQIILINDNLVNRMITFGVQSPEPAPGTEMPKSAVWVPLIVGDVVKGHVSLQNVDRENAFLESDVRLLTTLANSMSVALENARLFDETNRLLNETQQRNAELSILNAIQRGLVMEMDFQAIIDLVGDKLREALDFQDIGIRLYDKQTNLLHFPYEYEHGKRLLIEPMTPTAISEYVLTNKKKLLLKKNTEEELKKLGLKGVFVIPGTDWSKSLIAVPIILGDEARGLIMIENYEKEDAFNDSEIRLIMTLANSMSVALENARLFNETQQRNAELSILNIIQQGLVMEMDFQGIIDLVGDKLRETLGFQDIGIRLYNKETNMIHFPYEYEHGERLTLESNQLFGVSKYVIKNKKMILVKKNTDDSLKEIGIEETAAIPGTDRSKSLVAVPIMLGDDVRGLIIIENYEKEDAFNESDIRLLTTLSNSMSVALENARLFNETTHLLEETKQRAAELSTVNSISKALASHLELDKLINLVGEKMRELFKPNMAYVALYEKGSQMIHFPYRYGDEFPPLRFGEGMTSKIIISGEPLLINKEIDTLTAQLGIQRIGIPASSYLGVPIPVGDEIIGVISVQSTEKENRFSESDMRLLNTIAANVGVAINNAEAYRQLNKTVDQLNVTLKDLKSTQQQLIIQEKLASLGQLTAGIAHEIKNPLNFVNNFAEISIDLVNDLREEFEKIKQNVNEEEVNEIKNILKDLEENAQRINQHGKRADSIVRSMLQHSRGKAGEHQDSDINSILEEDLNLAYHGMRARDVSFNITIEKEFAKNLNKISVIPQDISRVFLNIINNGFYEANKKKKMTNGDFSPTLKVKTVDTNDSIEIHIKDNGDGIPLEVRDKLFNPFFTTKPTGEGTGLGLSLSHDIVVKQHQGDIRFESELGKFTEFIISLPKNGK